MKPNRKPVAACGRSQTRHTALKHRRWGLPAFGVRAAALGAAGRVGNFDIEGGACAHRRFKTDRAAHQYRQRLA